MSKEDDLKAVINLLNEIKYFFQLIIEDAPIINNTSYRDQLIDIWNEDISGYIKDIIYHLETHESVPPAFRERGLFGKQLKLKISIFKNLEYLYKNCSISTDKVKIAGDIFDFIKSILESIGGVYIDAVLEFINAIKAIFSFNSKEKLFN